MRILVTGSRDWDDEDRIWDALSDYMPTRGSLMHTVTLVHGACPTGADDLASTLWTANGGLEEAHPADWSQGRKAGPLRNQHMVSLGADVCLAFIGDCTSPRCNIDGKHPSHGASGCADLAENAGIETRRFYA